MNVRELIEHLKQLTHQDATVEIFLGKQQPNGGATGPEYELAEILEIEAESRDGKLYFGLPPGQPTDLNVVTISIGLHAKTDGVYVLDISAEE